MLAVQTIHTQASVADVWQPKETRHYRWNFTPFKTSIFDVHVIGRNYSNYFNIKTSSHNRLLLVMYSFIFLTDISASCVLSSCSPKPSKTKSILFTYSKNNKECYFEEHKFWYLLHTCVN